ncbi:hypothetical protein PVAP13_3NG180792 [Panicum virgatum]|uniref:Uncharacterized protein n=1 Tax=Panicum virgatum TaxID=38727 RepID=A0A8T0U5W9_PANVG|nr:hypothetical protein PVAP13_3NG180792 [Panicum virgatum]
MENNNIKNIKRVGNFELPCFFNCPPYFTLQPSIATREVQVRLWKELILEYCRSQRIYTISLEQDFPFSNPAIQRHAEWMDRNCNKCLILWLTIQDWANYILNFVKENGLGSTMPVEDIRSGFDTRGTELAGIDSIILTRALRLLEQKGKAAIFKVNDCEGVKFCI